MDIFASAEFKKITYYVERTYCSLKVVWP